MGAGVAGVSGLQPLHLPPTMAWPLGNLPQPQASGLGRLTLHPNPRDRRVPQITLASATGSAGSGNVWDPSSASETELWDFCRANESSFSHPHPRTWDRTHSPGMRPDGELNRQPLSAQDSTHPPEPLQPAHRKLFLFLRANRGRGVARTAEPILLPEGTICLSMEPSQRVGRTPTTSLEPLDPVVPEDDATPPPQTFHSHEPINSTGTEASLN